MTTQALSEAADGGAVADEAAEIITEDTTVVENTDAGADNPDNSTADMEREARSMGWVPETEWKGDRKPPKFYSAEEFIERGKNLLPLVNAENKRLKAELEAKNQELTERLERMDRMHKRTREREIANIRAEYERRREAAVEMGDKDAYRAAQKEEAEALKGLEDEPEAKNDTKSGALTPAQASAFSEWHAENAWFGQDGDIRLTAAMDAEFKALESEMSGLTFTERLEEARNRVAERFPEKFGRKTERKTPAVEGGARISGAGGGKLSTKLGAEERKQAQKDVDAGLYKSVEDWAKAYFE